MAPQPLSKKLCFKTTDKDGMTVALEKDCWYGHILREHRSQMSYRLNDTKTTIETADRIDDYFVNGIRNRVYFKHWKDRDRYGQEYLKVPTQIVDDNQSIFRVLTAHPMYLLPPKLKGTK